MKTPSVQTVPAAQWRANAEGLQPIKRCVPEETAIGLCYDSEPYAVLMATPQDLEDLAIGFTITERIASAGDVADVRRGEHPDGIVVDVLLTPEGRRKIGALRPRTLEGRSGCGLCGVQSLEDAVRPLPRLEIGLQISPAAVQTALAALEAQQPLGQATRATHAAAWADASGRLLAVREDVGRHNALDKLIGAAARLGLDPSQALIVVTSRCSYEMVEKTAVAGVAVLAAISAPTALAIRKARAANLTLIALARGDGHAVFAGDERMQGAVPAAQA
jgi:FdhD protein